ncbi:hypothetical protein AaE_012000 [Aphanomyces astaci]|uniref:Reverse transcriptase Ty1/copia-type domain-containing protein n=1 Tax=Aphanomyces astaci TaxID=112090 RepID=A0A6A4ZJP4_APHAT|nr:hypothetical protein AaE_012000 [Aphanomyces astaci]
MSACFKRVFMDKPLTYGTGLLSPTCLGFARLHKDRCVFLKARDDGWIHSLYVDDLLIISPTKALAAALKESLSLRFQMKDLGPVRDILGWEIVRDRSKRTLFIHQSRYCSTVLDRFDMSTSKPVATPFECTTPLSKAQCASSPEDIAFMHTKPYRSIVGSIMYLAMGSRPDWAYAIKQLSQFLHNPGIAHWRAAKRVLRYLQGNSNLGLMLGGRDYVSKPFLFAYVDANYAMCPDTRRCVSGFFILFFNSLISRLSKKQGIVTVNDRGRVCGSCPLHTRIFIRSPTRCRITSH